MFLVCKLSGGTEFPEIISVISSNKKRESAIGLSAEQVAVSNRISDF